MLFIRVLLGLILVHITSLLITLDREHFLLSFKTSTQYVWLLLALPIGNRHSCVVVHRCVDPSTLRTRIFHPKYHWHRIQSQMRIELTPIVVSNCAVCQQKVSSWNKCKWTFLPISYVKHWTLSFEQTNNNNN